jgi:Spy/CpxP family protein refolding chaperone
MKKSTKIIGIATLVIGLSTAVFAFASNGHWKLTDAEKAEFVNDRIASKLELTESQKIQLSSLTDDILELAGEIKQAKNSHMELVQQLLSEPILDQSKALGMIRQTTQMINDKAPETIASLANFLDSLDDYQKAELQGFVEQKIKHRHEKH